MKKRYAILAAAVLMAGISSSAFPAAPTAIQFAKGKSGASVSGKLVGSDDLDYTLRASAGQTMTVDFKAGKGAAYFNVIAPGSSGEALFVGMNEGSNHFEGQLPADGAYTIRLYLMGAAKDSGKPVPFTLKVNVKGGAAPKAAGGGSPAEKACLAAVAKATGVSVGKLSVTDVAEAEAGVGVTVKVPEAAAPWSCLSDKKGKVQGVSFTGSEGGL